MPNGQLTKTEATERWSCTGLSELGGRRHGNKVSMHTRLELPSAISQRTQLVLGLATRQSQSLEIVEAMAAVAP